MNRIRVSEIFFSIQGESCSQGRPTVFVRLTGCPLRCHYCDSAYAFAGGVWYDTHQILSTIEQYSTRYVTVTGGEPLAQPACLDLLKQLCDLGYQVSIETSGALSIEQVDTRVRRIVDFKTPSSGEVGRNLWKNADFLTQKDEVKFVVGNRQDFDWTLLQLDIYRLPLKVDTIWVSPIHGQLAPAHLAEWLLASGVDVRLQVQLHKLLWGEVPGR